MTTKNWGNREFWGLSSDYDHDWILTAEQKKLRDDLIELCRIKIRPQASVSDKNDEFPRASLDALASLGLLGLMVPTELGGLGQSHLCSFMIVETLARYGCPSTAMIYSMHLAACAILLFRYHDNPTIKDLLKRLDKDRLVGTVAYSETETGGYIGASSSSKTKMLSDGSVKLLKYVSWATSAGFADWYCIQTAAPDSEGSNSDLCNFLVLKDEVRVNTDDYKSNGLNGNHSSSMVIDGVLPQGRMVGLVGDGKDINSEGAALSALLSSSCWNGVSMGCIDIAKKHVTSKVHATNGIRGCDYPSVQGHFAECLTSTNVSRSHIYTIAQAMDQVTNNNDWTLHKDRHFMPRATFTQWALQARLFSTQNVSQVSDKMMCACGGSYFKSDHGLERLLRDAKAASLMHPSNEAAKQLIGKMVLLGENAAEMQNQRCNEQILNHELSKMSLEEKEKLSKEIQEEILNSKSPVIVLHPFQETDFENPFNTAPPEINHKVYTTEDGVEHEAMLEKNKWTPLVLKFKENVSQNLAFFIFTFPHSKGHSGCFPGQFVQMRVKKDRVQHFRNLYPISPPDQIGEIEFLIKFESSGVMSKLLRDLEAGDQLVDIRGPCGGFEYLQNRMEELTIIASDTTVNPAIQIIRSSMKDPKDETLLRLIYYAEDFDQMPFKEELDHYQESSNRLKVLYTLGELPENWSGDEGLIDHIMIEKFISKPNDHHKIILNGEPSMIISCLHSLKTQSFQPQMIFIYGQLGVEQIRTVFGRHIKLSTHRD